MARFQYQARDRDGVLRSGRIEADDRASAARSLRERDLFPVRLTEDHPRPAGWASGLRAYVSPVPPARLSQFFLQLASLLRSGVTAHDAMRELSGLISDGRLGRAADEMAARLAEGEAIADQLVRYPALFPEYAVNVVRAGEQFGGLPQALQGLAEQFESEAIIEGRLRWVRWYYGATLVLAALVAPFPLMVARGFGWYARLAATRLLPGILVAFLVVWLIRGALRTPALRDLYARISCGLPVVGSAARWAMIARTLDTLELSQQAGVTLDRGLQMAGEASGHPVMRRGATRASERVRRGESLGQATSEMEMLPRRVREMLAGAERSGGLERVLSAARAWAEERRDEALGTVVAGFSGGALVLAGIVTLVALAIAWRNFYEALFERAGV